MSIFSNAKVEVSIGTAHASAAAVGDLSADTFTAIGEIEDIGEFGDTSEQIKFNSLSDARVRKLKGVRDAGTLEITVGRDPADAGQLAVRAAAATENAYAFKVELTDKPLTGASPKNTVFYFLAYPSVSNVFGGVNDVTKQKLTLDITSAIFEVAASAT